ncbi:hypothetical protein [Pseudonocardia spinosispora]|uniref:hypothetical protein n=1 Tax=Pseudonocardia spinosispora TaxID=103441 RepID=UPI00040D7D9F|nr:hypothetical protein [Pseudonocardia spinosispora]
MSAPWKLVTSVALVIALAGIGAAGYFGYSWFAASSTGVVETAQARTDALKAARELVVTLQTVDPQQPDQSMRAWQAAATGQLLVQLQKDQNKYLDQLKKTPTRSSASVLDAALTELDAQSGTATAIAALDVTQSTAGPGAASQPTVRQLRVKLSLNRTDAGWKVAKSGLVNA